MTLAIFSDGKEYISAIRAGQKTGYTSDYIGQLCRARKIPGKLIGKTWYVEFPALLEYKNRRKPRGGIERNHATTHISEIRKIILPQRLSCESESLPLFPKLSKKGHRAGFSLMPDFIMNSAKLSFILICFLSLMFLNLENTLSARAIQLEKKVQVLSRVSQEFKEQIFSENASLGITEISLLGSVMQAPGLFVQSWINLKQSTLSKFIK